jgi:acetolactate decarboxylase
MFRCTKIIFCFVVLTTISFAQHSRLTQVSTINALMTGVYDGNCTLLELKNYGNFGIGTFNNLDGEMALLDGVCYKMQSDGNVVLPPDNEKVPFASVAIFHSDTTISLDDLSQKSLISKLDSSLPTVNIFFAVRIDGKFSKVNVRSVPKQSPPYVPLIQVIQKQSVFAFENIEGTLIAFRCPDYANGVNVPGYHFHFISKDKQKGGHVLDFTLERGTAKIEKLNEFLMLLPSDKAFYEASLSADKERELNIIEK